MGLYQFRKEHLITAPIGKVWDFISSPANLGKITPAYMDFTVTSFDLPEKMYEGMIISYKVKPFPGIKLTWVTEITHVVEGIYFVDEQRIGPYSIWHHEHILEQKGKQVLMKDIVSYKPPLGFIGQLANFLFIKNQLNKIFDYREKVINELFNHKME